MYLQRRFRSRLAGGRPLLSGAGILLLCSLTTAPSMAAISMPPKVKQQAVALQLEISVILTTQIRNKLTTCSGGN